MRRQRGGLTPRIGVALWLVTAATVAATTLAMLIGQAMMPWALLVVGALVALSLVASLWWSSRLLRPVLAVEAAVRRVAAGDLATRLPTSGERDDECLASSFNAMVSAIQQREAYLQAQNREMARLVTDEALHTGDLAGAARLVTETAARVAAVARTSLWLYNSSRDAMVCEDMFDARSASHTQGQALTERAYPAYFAALAGTRAIVASDACQDPRTRELKDPYLTPAGIVSVIHAPIHSGGRAIGVVCFEHAGGRRAWAPEEEAFAGSTADLVSLLLAARERRSAQEALLRAKEAAESASQAKSQFLANMSHEIRTPLTGVVGMLQLLRRTRLDAKQERYVANAAAAAETLLAVIGDVLDFSKIEAGRLELDDLAFSVADVVDGAVRSFAGRAEEKGLELVYQVERSVPDILRGDPNRLRQVLVNLVGNAIKFTERGQVIVDCRSQERTPDALTLRFEVRDTGCGIPADKQSSVFESFTQVDASPSRRCGGSGLGLAISRQLCEMMGGTIGLHSEPGKGSTFWFTVRLKVSEPTQAVRPRELPGLRVLIADDCAATRRILHECIASWRAEAVEAADGVLVLLQLQYAARAGRPFDVALLDWHMPGLDGTELARMIKGDPELKGTALVLLSSLNQPCGAADTALFAACVPKPVRPADLYDAILVATAGETTPQPSAPPAAPGRAQAPPEAVRPATILLAEDNPINQELVAEMVSSLGHRCERAATGREALDRIRQAEPDLVLMDCQMPEMDGYAACREIRRWEQGRGHQARRLPIVALTAHAAAGDRERCLEAGMDDYLVKPLDPDALARVVAKWLSPPDAAPAAASPVHNPTDSHPPQARALDYPELLRRCMGKRDLASRLLVMFTNDLRNRLATLELAIQRSDKEAIVSIAHSLMGASANVSAGLIHQISTHLLGAARSGDISEAPRLLDALRQAERDFAAAVSGIPPVE